MRSFCFLASAAALVGCTTAPDPTRAARADAEFQQLVAGKVAGAPVSCLARSPQSNMVVIDDSRVAFRSGARVFVNDFRGGSCARLGSGHYTLVTRSSGGGLCSGDFAEVVDTSTGMTMGSCVLGDFVPYNEPRG